MRMNFPHRGRLYTVTTKQELLDALAEIARVEATDPMRKAS